MPRRPPAVFRAMMRLTIDVVTLLRLSLQSRTAMAAENLFLRKHLALYRERQVKPRRADPATRVALMLLARVIDWTPVLTVVQPATLLRWHRAGWRLFWRWTSRPRGRPRIPRDLQQLIVTMARANPTWGEERIANELSLKLGIAVSPRTVAGRKQPDGGGAAAGRAVRKAAEGAIRTALVKEDLIEAVIGLVPNLFYGTQLAGCILVFRRKKPAARRKKALVVDASRLFRERPGAELSRARARRADRWLVPGLRECRDHARVVSLDEIEKESWTLNISRYVLPPIGADIPPLPEAAEAFKTALAEARAAEDLLRTLLTEGGWLK